MKFETLKESNRKNKRFVMTFSNPDKTIHFGQYGGTTYIDEGDKIKRTNYLNRHKTNENWDEVNAGSLSRFILWGDSRNINKNLKNYIKQFDL
jgi:hypothetical protein